ncbi:hypothetical protein NIES25_69890 (plasmid) [Nostoc linckia NIES-25]|nr:hypothetical protein NIES25_69890 [Nostoc linckia NIES-25]
MKAIKSVLIAIVTSLTVQSLAVAQTQSNPEFCQIHAGNVGQYASQYYIGSNYTPTPYRLFIGHSRAYKLDGELIAQPLYYMDAPSDTVAAAFQLKGKYGDRVIGDREITVQIIRYYPMSSTFEIVGFCVNGTFAPNQKLEAYDTRILPFNTLSALQEANIGLTMERTDKLFK